MKSTTTLTYYIIHNKFTYGSHIERENSDEKIDPETFTDELQEHIKDVMRHQGVSGTITITIETEG